MKKPKELTPFRAVLVYTVAMALVVCFEFPRVSSWARDTWGNLTSGETSVNIAENIPEAVAGNSQPAEKAQKTCSIPAAPAKAPSPATAPATKTPATKTVDDGQNGAKEDASVISHKLSPHKVLLVGDSEIAEGFGPALQRKLAKYSTVEVVRKGFYSTGFVHQETFSWTATISTLIGKYHPDMIVMHMGANDPIDIVPKTGRRLYFGNDQWKEVYSSRVAEFLKTVSQKKILLFWVGLPIMGSQKYCEKIEVLNSVFRQECGKASGCLYVDTWPALTGSNGKYTAYIRGPGGKFTRIRAKDNVHLTGDGGKILSDYFLKVASARVRFSNGDKVSSSK